MSDMAEKIPQQKTPSHELYQELIRKFDRPLRPAQLEKQIYEAAESRNLSNSTTSRLKAKILESGVKELKIKWPNGNPFVHLYSAADSSELAPLEVAMAMCEGGYICYQPALFWNELSEQVPRTLFVARERPKTSPVNAGPVSWDDLELRDAFVKAPIEHKKVALFRDHRIIVVDRAHSGGSGLMRKEVKQGKRVVNFLVTDLERTLLDCAVTPENAGGIVNVGDAIEAATERLNIDKLIEMYKRTGFKYPHWQRIAFLLKHFAHPKQAQSWLEAFGKPRNRFYLSKGYRAEWPFDEESSVYYPPGLTN